MFLLKNTLAKLKLDASMNFLPSDGVSIGKIKKRFPGKRVLGIFHLQRQNIILRGYQNNILTL